ncbi:hypothetical protein CBL_00046 [Carabus blaptoides fortunei]
MNAEDEKTGYSTRHLIRYVQSNGPISEGIVEYLNQGWTKTQLFVKWSWVTELALVLVTTMLCAGDDDALCISTDLGNWCKKRANYQETCSLHMPRPSINLRSFYQEWKVVFCLHRPNTVAAVAYMPLHTYTYTQRDEERQRNTDVPTSKVIQCMLQ